MCMGAVVGNGAIIEAPATGVERACDRVSPHFCVRRRWLVELVPGEAEDSFLRQPECIGEIEDVLPRVRRSAARPCAAAIPSSSGSPSSSTITMSNETGCRDQSPLSGDAGFILQGLSEYLDGFILDYLRVNESACK